MEGCGSSVAVGTTTATAEASTSAFTSVSTATSTTAMSGATAATPVMMVVTQEKPVTCEILDPGEYFLPLSQTISNRCEKLLKMCFLQ